MPGHLLGAAGAKADDERAVGLVLHRLRGVEQELAGSYCPNMSLTARSIRSAVLRLTPNLASTSLRQTPVRARSPCIQIASVTKSCARSDMAGFAVPSLRQDGV
jgi:hypothetical protein